MPTAFRRPIRGLHRTAIDSERGRIAIMRTDPNDEPEPSRMVVMVNGLGDTKEHWAPVLRKIARAGYDVCSYDHLGQAESGGPDQSGYYTLESMAADLLSVVDAMAPVGHPVHLVGSCLGGFVARELAATSPHRVRSLVLLGSGLDLATSSNPVIHEQIEQIIATGGVAGVFEDVRAGAMRAGISHRTLELVRESYLTTRPGFFAGFSRSAVEHRVGELAPGLPVLVAHGSADAVWTPRVQQAMAERLRARLVVIEGAGHTTMVTHPTTTTDSLVRFWHDVELPVPAAVGST